MYNCSTRGGGKSFYVLNTKGKGVRGGMPFPWQGDFRNFRMKHKFSMIVFLGVLQPINPNPIGLF